eukprot:UN13513
MEYWTRLVEQDGWENPDVVYNNHVIPFYELIRGYRFDHIGCLKRFDDTVSMVQDTITSRNISRGDRLPKMEHINSYEHKGKCQ